MNVELWIRGPLIRGFIVLVTENHLHNSNFGANFNRKSRFSRVLESSYTVSTEVLGEQLQFIVGPPGLELTIFTGQSEIV